MDITGMTSGQEGTAPAPESSEEAGWKHLRLLWCDAAGIRRCRVVPAARFHELCQDGLGVAYACMFLPSHADACPPDPEISPVGEMRLVPVLDTLRRALPWHPTHALALATAYSERGIAGGPWICCPRSALARVLSHAFEAHGITIKAGFESEFVLLDKGKAQAGPAGSLPPPVDESLYCQSSALDAMATVLDAMCDALDSLGIAVDQLHAESGHGQFEIATRYCGGLEACDNLLLTREAITAVAARHGLLASFLPKLRTDQAGNGCHCHFSIWQNDTNLLRPPSSAGEQFSAVGEAFLAGVLQNLSALLCFTASSPNSYRRLQPSSWSGGFQCWGVQNREAALRICSTPGRPDSHNCELKSFDASANPYLGLAALVVAGLEGIRHSRKLPAAMNVDPSSLPPAELAALGIKRLPANLGQAMDALRQNEGYLRALEEALGEGLVRALLAVRREEWKVLGRKGIKEEALALAARY